MRIETRALGSIEIDETQVVELTEPMPGFPGLLRFAVLEPEPDSPFQWFQAVDRVDLCFLIADPARFFPDYRPSFRWSDLSDLQVSGEEDVAVAVVLRVPEDYPQATANLLAPIVFNVRRRLARQVILEGSGYPVRARLFQEEKRLCQAG